MQNDATEHDPKPKGHNPQNFDPDDSIGDIIGRILADGRELAEAEIKLMKVKTLRDSLRFRKSAMLAGGAFIFAAGAIVSLFWGVAAALAAFIGPLLGGIAAAAIAIVISAILGRMALDHLRRNL